MKRPRACRLCVGYGIDVGEGWWINWHWRTAKSGFSSGDYGDSALNSFGREMIENDAGDQDKWRGRFVDPIERTVTVTGASTSYKAAARRDVDGRESPAMTKSESFSSF
jgi:hypothetical protein